MSKSKVMGGLKRYDLDAFDTMTLSKTGGWVSYDDVEGIIRAAIKEFAEMADLKRLTAEWDTGYGDERPFQTSLKEALAAFGVEGK